MLVTFIGWTLATAFYTVNKDQKAAHAVLGIIPLFYFFYNIGACALRDVIDEGH